MLVKPGDGCTSYFRGVCWDKNRGNYKVTLQKNKVKLVHQRYDNEIEAARAYDRAALLHHGRCTHAQLFA